VRQTPSTPEFFDQWVQSFARRGERPRHWNVPPEHPRLVELCTLLGTEVSDIAVIHSIQSEPPEECRTSKSGRRYSMQIGSRVTWKMGYDFRTAAPYAFVWLDGEQVVYRWPQQGQSSHWLD